MENIESVVKKPSHSHGGFLSWRPCSPRAPPSVWDGYYSLMLTVDTHNTRRLLSSSYFIVIGLWLWSWLLLGSHWNTLGNKVARELRFESRNGLTAQSLAKKILECAEEWHLFYYLNQDYLVQYGPTYLWFRFLSVWLLVNNLYCSVRDFCSFSYWIRRMRENGFRDLQLVSQQRPLLEHRLI